MRPRFLGHDVWKTEVQALQLGAVHIVALPGEPYVELGLRIKGAHPEALVVPLGYSNDSIYYVPMDANHSERRYENVAAVVARGSQGLLEDAANRLIEKLS